MSRQRYFIYLSYFGARYCGWQKQPDLLAVQQVVSDVLSIVLRKEITAVGAGRTDAGVHAKMMVAHFDMLTPPDNLPKFVARLNRFLPQDIAINKIVRVTNMAHARFSALSRRYEYLVTLQKNPFLTPLAHRVTQPLNIEQMNCAAAKLMQYSDFTSFSKLHTDVKHNRCVIKRAEWTERDGVWVFTIEADRFLRNMVRAIVGTLLDVGTGKRSVEDFCEIIEAKDRCRAGMSAPACGLYLVHVDYPATLFLE
ncbi:MAG: tRNA pseudouridine(38-40) synthase TruA [Prevotellaceae bacterium]|nr:tRNA pseudouridine(38-40) synthase TruA [Prevotellaceae bacterium]